MSENQKKRKKRKQGNIFMPEAMFFTEIMDKKGRERDEIYL